MGDGVDGGEDIAGEGNEGSILRKSAEFTVRSEGGDVAVTEEGSMMRKPLSRRGGRMPLLRPPPAALVATELLQALVILGPEGGR